MENTLNTYIDGIIKKLPTLVEDQYGRSAISYNRQVTKIVLEFIATYNSPKGECYVLKTLCAKFSENITPNVNPVTQISSTLAIQLGEIRQLVQDDAHPSKMVNSLSYKVWLSGSRVGSGYEASLF